MSSQNALLYLSAYTAVFLATQNGGIVSGFPSTVCFTFGYVRYCIRSISTIAHRAIIAFLVSVKQRRGPKMWLHRVHQSQITTPTERIPPFWAHSGIILRIFSVALAILLLKKNIKRYQNQSIFKGYFSSLKSLKENLREEDNLSTKGQLARPQCVLCSEVLPSYVALNVLVGYILSFSPSLIGRWWCLSREELGWCS